MELEKPVLVSLVIEGEVWNPFLTVLTAWPLEMHAFTCYARYMVETGARGENLRT